MKLFENEITISFEYKNIIPTLYSESLQALVRIHIFAWKLVRKSWIGVLRRPGWFDQTWVWSDTLAQAIVHNIGVGPNHSLRLGHHIHVLHLPGLREGGQETCSHLANVSVKVVRLVVTGLVRDVGGLPGALHLEAGDEAHQAGVLLGQVRQCGQAAQHAGHCVVINVIKSPHL